MQLWFVFLFQMQAHPWQAFTPADLYLSVWLFPSETDADALSE